MNKVQRSREDKRVGHERFTSSNSATLVLKPQIDILPSVPSFSQQPSRKNIYIYILWYVFIPVYHAVFDLHLVRQGENVNQRVSLDF